MYKYLHIYNSPKLSGSVEISGAKNAALPLIAASILSNTDTEMTNVPNVADVKTLLKLLSNLGAKYNFEKNTLTINTSTINNTTAVYEIVKTMRASILVLGPLLARFNECKVSLPGGCAIGARPVDLHLKALEAMGAEIKIEGGYIHAKGRLKGCDIVFDKITVTGTENIIMAASLAKGVTKIINAAKEPEVVQLCEVLISAGVESKESGFKIGKPVRGIFGNLNSSVQGNSKKPPLHLVENESRNRKEEVNVRIVKVVPLRRFNLL
jgi:UDP-N-acetylglucosamine 1-carboxyvinyltransferase